MEFKSSAATFDNKPKFSDDFRRFISDEAARFTPGSNEAASANIDEFAEESFRFSANKNKGKAKQLKQEIKALQKEREEIEATRFESINPSEDMDYSADSSSRSSKSGDETKESEKYHSKDEEAKELRAKEVETRENSVKSEKSKEQKRAGAKTAVAAMFKAKKELSNDLAGTKSSGNAFTDGNTGLMKVFTEYLNPMHYVKKLCGQIAAVVAPYLLGFMAIFSVLLVIVAFLFSILQPLAEVAEGLGNFMSFFSGGGSTFVNSYLSQDEIDEIVAASGADDTQEIVIRYALSKVGFPYSQANRTSGSAYDCSSLVYYAWRDAGVDISFGTGYPPTAAEGARQLQNHGKALSSYMLESGDLIYYGGSTNGRYLGIYHVAIYVGNGKVVEALNDTYGVVYRDLKIDKAIMVVRPNL